MTAKATGALLVETAPPAAIPIGARPRKRGGPWLGSVSALAFACLYLPLSVVVLYSFRATKVNAWPIKGYALDWYRELMVDDSIHESIRLSIFVSLIASSV